MKTDLQMALHADIVENLEKIFTEFSNLDELPHSFDDSLISKFVDYVEIDEKLSTYIWEQLLSKSFCDRSVVARSFLSKLAEKTILVEGAKCDNKAKQFLNDSFEKIFEKEALEPFFDLLPVCIIYYKNTPPPDVLVEQCISFLSDEVISIFLRRKLEDLICLASEEIIGNALTSITKIFCEAKSPIIRNGVCRIFECRLNKISSSNREMIFKNVQNSSGEGEIVYRLISNIITDPLVAENSKCWASEIVRTSIALLIAKTLKSGLIFEKLAISLFSTSKPKFRYFVELFPFISDGMISEFLPVFASQLSNKSKSPVSDIVNFFIVACPRLEKNTLFDMLEKCNTRFFDSHSILEKVHDFFGDDIINEEGLKSVKENLITSITNAISGTQWEDKDTAVEIAALFPSLISYLGNLEILILKESSPYVRAAALRCYLKHNSLSMSASELCAKVFNCDNDPEPRRMAVAYLQSQLPDTLDISASLLSKAMEDPDIDIRYIMLSICETDLIGNSKYSDLVKKEMLEWTEDPEVGSRARKLLGSDEEANKIDPAEHILSEMMIGLSIGCTDEIDCY